MDVFDRYKGQLLDRRYRIIHTIGIGGMAVVFEAVDTVMKRPVAVKMLKDEISNDQQAVKRFINESKAVSMLSHPNIVSIYDVSVKDDLKYIVMERVDGITLKNYMQQKGALPPREIVALSEQILRALAHAHAKGVIHRDIKPQNIMLLKTGQIKVTDFGIAKLPQAETVTRADQAIGTVYYISPEQASGKLIDPRSDLYSLGVVMYEMATGCLPFTGDTPVAIALKQVGEAPVPPRRILSSVPTALEQIILTAMEKDPARRFQSADQMLRVLQQINQRPDTATVRHPTSPIPLPNPSQTTAPHQGGARTTMPKSRTGSTPIRSDPHRPAQRKSATSKTVSGNKTVSGKKKASGKKRKESRSMFPIILGVTAAFFIVLGISGIWFITKLLDNNASNRSITIDIPKLEGSLYTDDLRSQLDAKNYYRVVVQYAYNEDYVENTIIAQNPAAGESRKVTPGSQYTDLLLTVSRGTETVELPDCTIKDYRVVENALRKLGTPCTIAKENNDTVEYGYVIRMYPAAGSQIRIGSTVTLYVSRGPRISYSSVPDFRTKTCAQATKLLETFQLDYGIITYQYSEEVKRDCIISQSIPPGTEVPVGVTVINFVVSLGSKDAENTENSETTKDPEETNDPEETSATTEKKARQKKGNS